MQVWLILTQYSLKQACSKQGSPDMQPWTGDKLLFISRLYGHVFCYSEPVWQCPGGIAKAHVAQKKTNTLSQS